MKLHPRADRAKFTRIRAAAALSAERLHDWLAWRRVLRVLRERRAPATPDVRLIVIGQSHLRCLRQAWQRGSYWPADPRWSIRFIAFREPVVERAAPGQDSIPPALQSAFERHRVLAGNAETWIVSIVRGNDYNHYGFFESDPPFDFIHPAIPDLPLRQDAQLIPYDVVRKKLEWTGQSTRRFFACLPRTNIAGVVHIEAPPPIPDEAHCQRSFERALLARSLGRTEAVRVSPRDFRMKLYRAQADVNRQVCREQNVLYVEAPEEALDAAGFLKPAAWHGATHATAWYGALALRKVERLIESQRAARGVAPPDAVAAGSAR